MHNRLTISIALTAATLLSLATLTPALAQKGPGDPEPAITLRLLVQDAPGRQSEPAALDLVRLAEELSGGAITIVPTFDGGDVATAVIDGDAELGMVPSRDWGAVGVTSLHVLEAPFLIDDDALALAVATSDIADRAMAGLDAVGVTGLAMWPEDLRHLFALNPSGAELSTPEGLADADVLVVAGIPGHDLITTLGGRIYAEYEAAGDLTGDRFADASAGTLEGMVTGLWGAGLPIDDVTVAGDLVVYSKYQMLVGNAQAIDRLSEQQRAYLDEIVAAAHAAALGRHYTEAELAAQLCELGGRVVSLGAPAVGSFKAAAQPLTEALSADPVTGELMAAVEALRGETPVAPGAGTCEPAQRALPSVAPSDVASELPAPGVWRISHTIASLVDMGVSPQRAPQWAGSVTMTLDGQRWDFIHSTGDGDFPCGGTYSLDDDDLVLTFETNPQSCGTEPVHLRWAASGTDMASVREVGNASIFSGEWTRIADAAASPGANALIGDQPVPAGSYRVAVSLEELEAAGATRDFAGRNAGVWTWTFTDDGWSAVHDVRNEQCSGGMTVAGDRVELSDSPTAPCTLAYDLRWRLEGDGIRFEVLDVNWTQATPEILADERALTERVWSRVE